MPAPSSSLPFGPQDRLCVTLRKLLALSSKLMQDIAISVKNVSKAYRIWRDPSV